MKPDAAVEALGSLAQVSRLAVFRMLVQSGREGMSAGEIARALDMPASSLSFHLAHLARAGLVSQKRQSRHIIYRADYGVMNKLVGYLLENCCEGHGCEADAGLVRKAC